MLFLYLFHVFVHNLNENNVTLNRNKVCVNCFNSFIVALLKECTVLLIQNCLSSLDRLWNIVCFLSSL